MIWQKTCVADKFMVAVLADAATSHKLPKPTMDKMAIRMDKMILSYREERQTKSPAPARTNIEATSSLFRLFSKLQ
jgi:hypothetical protein